jgi:hypothetical protein
MQTIIYIQIGSSIKGNVEYIKEIIAEKISRYT